MWIIWLCQTRITEMKLAGLLHRRLVQWVLLHSSPACRAEHCTSSNRTSAATERQFTWWVPVVWERCFPVLAMPANGPAVQKAHGMGPGCLRGKQLAQQSTLDLREWQHEPHFSPVLTGDEKTRSTSSNFRGAEGGYLGSKILFTVPLS